MPDSADQTITGKMVILGDQGVGKTSLVLRYVEKEYNRYISPTIGASYFSCSIQIQNVTVKLQLWDTAGQERFKAMAPMFYRNASAAMLVFDITRQDTFENMKNWVLELRGHVTKAMVIFIIGSKLDLSKDRQVSRDEAAQYSNSIGANYYECSAMKDMGIEQIFKSTALELVRLSGIVLSRRNVPSENSEAASSECTATDEGNIVVIRGSKENIAHGEVVTSNCC